LFGDLLWSLLKMNLGIRVLDSKLIGCCDAVDRGQTPGRHHGPVPSHGLQPTGRHQTQRPSSNCALITARTRPILVLPVPLSSGRHVRAMWYWNLGLRKALVTLAIVY